MDKDNIKQLGNEASNAIEDLTLNETETANIKGGAVDMFLRLDGIKGEIKDTSSATTIAGYDLKLNKKV